jgi:hypothetical protein
VLDGFPETSDCLTAAALECAISNFTRLGLPGLASLIPRPLLVLDSLYVFPKRSKLAVVNGLIGGLMASKKLQSIP